MEEIKLTSLATCSGCGAKLGGGTLGKFLKDIKSLPNSNIIVGFNTADDACVYKISEDTAIVQTVDFFPPIVDSPYMYGQIAAANALSDVYAMGGTPTIALNLMCTTDALTEDIIAQILKGGADKVAESGASITGGHTIKSKEPIYGLSVTGVVHPDKVLKNSNAQIGDCLILTKKLGIGIITTSLKAGVCSSDAEDIAVASMATLNKKARDIMVKYNVNSCTDITGFGLAGHTMEMADGSNVTIELFADKVPYIPQAYEYALMGLIPAGSYRNREYTNGKIKIEQTSKAYADQALQDIIFDPQTSGGLLISLPQQNAQACLAEMLSAGIDSNIIGSVLPKSTFSIIFK